MSSKHQKSRNREGTRRPRIKGLNRITKSERIANMVMKQRRRYDPSVPVRINQCIRAAATRLGETAPAGQQHEFGIERLGLLKALKVARFRPSQQRLYMMKGV